MRDRISLSPLVLVTPPLSPFVHLFVHLFVHMLFILMQLYTKSVERKNNVDCRVVDVLPGGAVLYPARETFYNLRRIADVSDAADFEERNEMRVKDIRVAAKKFAELWTALGEGYDGTEQYCKIEKLTFDGVMSILFSFHVIQPQAPPLRRNPSVLYSCSCKPFQDDGVCKHSLYEGLKRREIRIPTLMHIMGIGRDVEAGRPRKTVAALLKQPGENPLPLPGAFDPDDPAPQLAEDEDDADWWYEGEDEPRGDPELALAPQVAAVPREEDAWVEMKKK